MKRIGFLSVLLLALAFTVQADVYKTAPVFSRVAITSGADTVVNCPDGCTAFYAHTDSAGAFKIARAAIGAAYYNLVLDGNGYVQEGIACPDGTGCDFYIRSMAAAETLNVEYTLGG